jgi:hypothetical protein
VAKDPEFGIRMISLELDKQDGVDKLCRCWGNSLSYASSSCDSGSSKPQILEDMLFKTDQEFVIFTDQKCNGDCGYYRDGIPAYRKIPLVV